jgi:hypothetical protein
MFCVKFIALRGKGERLAYFPNAGSESTLVVHLRGVSALESNDVIFSIKFISNNVDRVITTLFMSPTKTFIPVRVT